MTSVDVVWQTGRLTIGSLVRLLVPLRNYGVERVPRTGGIVLDDETDWSELAELLTDSYCVQAPARLARLVHRPT